MYSTHCTGFFASSVLRRIVRASGLQLPQRVFMRCTNSLWTRTPRMDSHVPITSAAASRTCRRYQQAMTA